MVFDQHQNAIPVAWIITSSCCGTTVKHWLQELHNRAILMNSEWKPNAFAIDDAAVDVEAIRFVCKESFSWSRASFKTCLDI